MIVDSVQRLSSRHGAKRLTAHCALACLISVLPVSAVFAQQTEQPHNNQAPRIMVPQEDERLEEPPAPVKAKSPKPQISFAELGTKSDTSAPPSKLLLKGQVNYLVPKGTGIKLKLATVPTHGLKLMDRDDDGNLYPAQEGQELTARTTEDLYVDDNKVIPGGTVFHGMVSKVIPPKRVGRPGSLVITFDRFTTPNKKTFAFRAEADNYRESTPQSKARGFGRIASYAAGGAITGALLAYQYFGPARTVAMHGYNVAGAAAAGALLATGYALWKRGAPAVLEPGDDLNMSIDCDLLLPGAVEPGAKPASHNLPGLDVEIVKSKVVKDGLDGHNLRVEMLVTNDSDKRLKSIDLYLQDDNGSKFPVASGEMEDEELLFDVDPHSMKRVKLDFQMEYPKLKRKLIWLDHSTQKKIYETPLP